MTTAFSGPSRLANFREKKNSNHEDPLNIQGELKLTLPDNQEKTSYEPSAAFSNTRTSMRLLKGKIQRKQSMEHTEIKSAGMFETQASTQQKLSLNDNKEDLKLVLHDSPQVVEKKVAEEPVQKAPQKRIMITKQPSLKEQPVKQVPQVQQPKQEEPAKNKKPQQQSQPKPQKQEPKQEKQEYKNPHDEKPIIKEQEMEESKQQPENENDLVLCPEGCGRKFNRKALEKHAKACKLVFMSKRKQFNSEAKRITSKEQANIVKQVKQKQKNQFGKTKGFQKTGDNWKAASQDFRAAIKAIKKDDDKDEEVDVDKMDGDQGDAEKQVALNLVACQFCEKMFAQVLLEKHLENCTKKKEKEKEKQKDKKKGGAAVKKK